MEPLSGLGRLRGRLADLAVLPPPILLPLVRLLVYRRRTETLLMSQRIRCCLTLMAMRTQKKSKINIMYLHVIAACSSPLVALHASAELHACHVHNPYRPNKTKHPCQPIMKNNKSHRPDTSHLTSARLHSRSKLQCPFQQGQTRPNFILCFMTRLRGVGAVGTIEQGEFQGGKSVTNTTSQHLLNRGLTHRSPHVGPCVYDK